MFNDFFKFMVLQSMKQLTDEGWSFCFNPQSRCAECGEPLTEEDIEEDDPDRKVFTLDHVVNAANENMIRANNRISELEALVRDLVAQFTSADPSAVLNSSDPFGEIFRKVKKARPALEPVVKAEAAEKNPKRRGHSRKKTKGGEG